MQGFIVIFGISFLFTLISTAVYSIRFCWRWVHRLMKIIVCGTIGSLSVFGAYTLGGGKAMWTLLIIFILSFIGTCVHTLYTNKRIGEENYSAAAHINIRATIALLVLYSAYLMGGQPLL